jgi:DNA-binding MarR family transcriptional regulator
MEKKKYYKTPISRKLIKEVLGINKKNHIYMFETLLQWASSNNDPSDPYEYTVGKYKYKTYFGQLHTTKKKLAKENEVSEKTVERYLEKFEEMGLIKKRDKGRCLLIEITDYKNLVSMKNY